MSSDRALKIMFGPGYDPNPEIRMIKTHLWEEIFRSMLLAYSPYPSEGENERTDELGRWLDDGGR